MGIFFDDAKPRVSKFEWPKVRSALYSENFTAEELNKIEEIFRGDMDESREEDKGIDAKEVSVGIEWMRKNMSKHHISSHHIDLLETQLKKYL